MSRDEKFEQTARDLGYSFEGEIKIGGNYCSIVRDARVVYISGQVPRVGSTVVVTGRAGEAVDLDGARLAAKICAMRALALLKQALGSLDDIERIAKINVYVQSASDFTQQSEVADAASDLLQDILGASGTHTRTSIGVYQLPKNASVELDMIAISASAPPA
jgi:enamine deaminase RidA (YjgF/YER057c/UK114 family)